MRALGGGNAVAQGPQRLGLSLVRGDRRVFDQPVVKRRFQQGSGLLGEGGSVGIVGDQFDQHIPVMPT